MLRWLTRSCFSETSWSFLQASIIIWENPRNPQGKLFLTEWVCMSNDVAWNSLLKPHENLGIFWRIIASATGMNFELFLPFCGRTYVATTKSSALKGLEVHSDHNIDESVFVKMWQNKLTTFLIIEDSKLAH